MAPERGPLRECLTPLPERREWRSPPPRRCPGSALGVASWAKTAAVISSEKSTRISMSCDVAVHAKRKKPCRHVHCFDWARARSGTGPGPLLALIGPRVRARPLCRRGVRPGMLVFWRWCFSMPGGSLLYCILYNTLYSILYTLYSTLSTLCSILYTLDSTL